MNGWKMTSTLQSSALRFLYFKNFTWYRLKNGLEGSMLG
jgi:hypothetical protein